MHINYFLLFGVTLLQFIFGALWYSPLLCGKKWMKIMGADKYSKEELEKMQKSMMPFYVLQFFLTLSTSTFLYIFMNLLPKGGALSLAGIIFVAFIVPTQISGIIWGNTEKKYWIAQVLIMAGCQAVTLAIAAFFFGM